MGDIVNLRMARKRKARAGREQEAEQNRALHGRSRAESKNDRQIAEKAAKFIDGHRLSPPTEGDGK
ncbi:MAG TPA: DUF4169 family protein [Mesorhizobium sp.]|jgi:hypothetical protein